MVHGCPGQFETMFSDIYDDERVSSREVINYVVGGVLCVTTIGHLTS